MNNIATRIVNNPPLKQKATTPQTKRAHRVRKNQPQRNKSHPGSNIHPPQNRPSQQNHRDGRKVELKVDHGGHRIKGFIASTMLGALGYLGLTDEILLAQRRRTLTPEREQLVTESHTIAEEDPADEDSGEGVEGHEGGVDCPFLFDDGGVEDHEPWHAL
ncbi:hypothetical protein HanIR_Chr13g0643661 [Helianthus annuus]|nr:hypothetical protein HanIR_Chr13g0643661 [Helianthus annuus]